MRISCGIFLSNTDGSTPAERNLKMNPLILVVGMPGTGKSTVVKFLERKGWPTIYFGQITLDEIIRRDMPNSEKTEKEVRESLRREHGNAVYAEMSMRCITQNLQDSPTIVDGLYSWDEYKFLRTHIANPMYIIAVCADRQMRYARLARRSSRPLKLVEAEKRDFAEIENIQKGGPIAIADFTILNNGLEQDLDTAVSRVVPIIMSALNQKGEED